MNELYFLAWQIPFRKGLQFQILWLGFKIRESKSLSNKDSNFSCIYVALTFVRKWENRCDVREKKKTEKELLLGCDSVPELPEEIVFELLTRLPVKKISQCKCVSKVWRSIIDDPTFAQSSRRRNPLCLVISVPVRRPRKSQRFYYSTFGSQPEPAINLFNTNLFDKKNEEYLDAWSNVTQVVNGLCCYYSRLHLSLGNVFTGESMRLPLPDVSPKHYFDFPEYYLGLDPVHGLYKLLHIRTLGPDIEKQMMAFQCDVLKLGSTNPSWRRLSDNRSPSSISRKNSIFISGALHWLSDGKENGYIGVVCFNLTEEKFHFHIFIFHPRYIDAIHHRPSYTVKLSHLVQFRGRLSVLFCLAGDLFIYTLEDGKTHKWTGYRAVLPDEFCVDGVCTAPVPVGSLPTCEILLMKPEIDGPITPIYYYDDANNKFERLVVGKLTESLPLKGNTDVLSERRIR